MNEDFELFQSEFKKWQQRFGLTGYHVFFKQKPLKDAFASIRIDEDTRVATAYLNNRLSSFAKPYKDIPMSAKHEAIHLLLAKLECYGRDRYIEPEEINNEVESLVFKLGGLIND